jgi:hypothetical protein
MIDTARERGCEREGTGEREVLREKEWERKVLR